MIAAIILGMLIGLLMAGCLAFMVTMILVCNSNVSGDSKGSFYTFSKTNLNMIHSEDGIRY